MGRHSSALSRSSLGLRAALAALLVLLVWRAAGPLLLSRSSPSIRKSDDVSDSAHFKLRDSLSESVRDETIVEYTDDKRLRAKRDMTPLSRRLRKKRALDQPPSSSPPSLAITAALPATADSLSKSFVSTYDELFNSLASTAEMLVADALTPALEKRLVGLPGTAISSRVEASALRAYLDCVSSTGEWVYEPEGISLVKTGTSLTVHKQEPRYAACDKRFYKGVAHDGAGPEWEVRESLKWSWRRSPTCEAIAPSSLAPSAGERARNALLPSRYRMCELLEGKHLLLVGDTTQWSLHDLLLDWTTLKPQTCYGDRYCMSHALCSDILSRGRKGSKEAREQARQQVESGEADQKVYHHLPLAPGVSTTTAAEKRQLGNVASPSGPHAGKSAASSSEDSGPDRSSSAEPLHEKREPARLVRTTLMRYRRADGLRFARNHVAPDYRPESNGVRELNQQWLADSRRSDLVILTKAPLPLPREGHNATFDAEVREYVAREEGVPVEAKALRVLGAAKWVTEQVWLPELVETLRAVRAPPSPPDQLVVYRGGWRQHVDCAASTLRDRVVDDFSANGPLISSFSPGDGPPPRASQPTWASLLMQPSSSSGDDESELVPLHIAYHNAQLVLQNHLARTVVLPAFGIPFLDLETPLSVWRSGMVGSSAASPFRTPSSAAQQQHQQQAVLSSAGLRSPTSGDCTRYCFPSPGLAVERFFLGALATVFEAGWAGDAQREAKWMGEGFENVQDRHHAPRD